MSLFPPGTGLSRQVTEHWFEVGAADSEAVTLFRQHYTCRTSRIWGTGNTNRFIGPGECMSLITGQADALFVWRAERLRADAQTGINCSVFRNTGAVVSSELIREADEAAWRRWPGERHYTFVDPRRVKSANPGFCFLMAGWRKCGVSKARKLIILERLP